MKALQHQPRIGLHWFYPFGSTALADICSQPAIKGPADLRLVFWDQEPVFTETAEAFWPQFRRHYNGPAVMVVSEQGAKLDNICDTYGISHAHYFFHGWAALDWYRGYNHSFLLTPWQSRQFQHRLFCPNNIIGGKRSHRLRLLSLADQRYLLPNNLFSFPEICPHEKQSAAELLQQLDLPALHTNLPLVIDERDNHAAQSHRIDFFDQAQRCFCHVVTETVYDTNRLFLTEKIFKPIVLQQPFVVVGSRGSLRYLRHYGFRTFSDLWDETYDSSDDGVRLAKITDVLCQINSWTDRELRDAQHHAKDIVAHNFQWFYGGFQDVLWQELQEMLSQWR